MTTTDTLFIETALSLNDANEVARAEDFLRYPAGLVPVWAKAMASQSLTNLESFTVYANLLNLVHRYRESVLTVQRLRGVVARFETEILGPARKATMAVNTVFKSRLPSRPTLRVA